MTITLVSAGVLRNKLERTETVLQWDDLRPERLQGPILVLIRTARHLPRPEYAAGSEHGKM